MPWQPLRSDGDDEPAKVGRPLDRLMRDLGAPAPATRQSVFDGWPDLVGPQLAERTRPLSLRDQVLVVGVDDPAWATQLRFLEAELLARIAEAQGPDEVRAIEVRVRPPR